MKMFMCQFVQDEVTHQRLRVGSKQSVQQGRSRFYARNVWSIREHGKMARTPLAAFFNRPIIGFVRLTETPDPKAGRTTSDIQQSSNAVHLQNIEKPVLEIEDRKLP